MIAQGGASLLIVSFSEIASDPRVRKEIDVAGARSRVTTLGFGRTPPGAAEHIGLPRLSTVPRTASGVAALATRRYDLAYWRVPAVLAARTAVAGRQFDGVICNDANTLPLALEIAGTAPVWADMHEYAPREADDLAWWRLILKDYVTYLCERHLPRVRYVSTVSQGLVDEYQHEFGVSPVLIRNSADYVPLRPTAVKQPIRYVHLGAAIRERRLEDLVEAALGLADRITLDLYLVPGDMRYVDELRRMASGRPHIRFPPPVPVDDVVSKLNSYDVGAYSLPPSNFNMLHACPNKFFQFVQARLALLFGPSPETSELIRRFDLGVVAPYFGPEALRQAMSTLDSELVARFKANADRAARQLSSEADNEERLRIIDDMLTAMQRG